MTFHRTYTVTRGFEEYEVECEFEVSSWGFAGSYWEPPEGIEAWLDSATIEAPAWARGKYPYNAIPFALTDAERWALEEQFYADPPEQDYGPDPDDERDQRYDEDRYAMRDANPERWP